MANAVDVVETKPVAVNWTNWLPALVKVSPVKVTKPAELATAVFVESSALLARASSTSVGLTLTVLATSRTRLFQASRISTVTTGENAAPAMIAVGC